MPERCLKRQDMTNGTENKLKFAQGTLGVRMKHGEGQQQAVDLAEVFGLRGIKFPGTDI